MTRKNTWARLALAVVLSLPLTACKDTKTLQENEQLKAQVAELQKENGQLGNDLETMTAARDALTKENEKLKTRAKGSENETLRNESYESKASSELKVPSSLKIRTWFGARKPDFCFHRQKREVGA